MNRFIYDFLAVNGSNRPASSCLGHSSHKRRRVTLTLLNDNVSNQEEFVPDAPVVPICPPWCRKNARTMPSVKFEQVQDSVQEESTSGPSQARWGWGDFSPNSTHPHQSSDILS